MATRNSRDLNGLKLRFAENLILARNRADLSQVTTAERSGLHVTQVSLLERRLRLPRLDTIVKLASARPARADPSRAALNSDAARLRQRARLQKAPRRVRSAAGGLWSPQLDLAMLSIGTTRSVL